MANSQIPDGQVPDGVFQTRAFDAEVVNLYVRGVLANYPALAQNAKTSSLMMEQTVKNAVFTITTWCAAGRIPDMVRSETFRYPDGVWQMFKSKYMPEWFTRRFPVKMHEETFEVQRNFYFVCPHLETPERGPHIQFMATGTKLGEWMSR